MRSERTRLANALGQLGLASPPSEANFILVSVPETSGSTAASLYAHLKASGILVRYFDAPMLADKLRITVGTAEQNDALIDTLSQALT